MGKAQNLLFNHLNVENGLSQNSVIAIAQDGHGFMWFGDRYGLNRYDGHGFRLYKNDRTDSTTISDDYITSLLCDAGHILWVGTTNGLNRYDPEKDAFTRITIDPAGTATPGNNISCMYKDRAGRLWVGTVQGLFAATSPDAHRFAAFPGAGENIRAIYEDRQGDLWIGGATGLTRMQPIPGGYRYKVFRHGGKGSLSDDHVTSVMEDSEQPGELWIGTLNGGVNKYNPGDSSFARLPGMVSDNIRTICPDQKGRLWIGTLEGLSILDPRTLAVRSYQHDPDDKRSLSQNSIYSIFRDAGGSIWIGTYFGGVNVTYSHTTPFTIYQSGKDRSSISNNVVSEFAEDKKHNLWIGTEGGGLNYLDRATGAFTAYKNIPNDPASLGSNLVKAVYPDRDGNLWVGTHGGGLNLLDPVHGRFRRFLYEEDTRIMNPEIGAILEDSRDRFWVGLADGMQVYKRNGTELSPDPGVVDLKPFKNDQSIRVIFEDSRKNIWVATARTLYILPEGQTVFKPFPLAKENNSLNSNFVNCIKEDARGRLWFGMYCAGLTVYDPRTGSMKTYTVKDGLPNNNVLGIEADDDGQFWLSTDDGLSRFDGKTFTNYTASDGLADNDFNYNSFFKDSKGELFFGGYNGFTAFFPGQIGKNDYTAPMVFTALDLFNKPVSIHGKDGILDKDIGSTDHIRFRYDQNAFTVNFALLNYIKPEKNKYAYKLEGFDKDWNVVPATSATYTSLPAGDYTFWVKGANNDGVWSKPAGLRITVLPPFWKTWWAYCLYALALGALLFLIARFFFLRELLKRENELHQAKLNFFTNISHEIRTHLALIIGPVEKLLLRRRDEEDQQQLRYVRKNSESLLQLVSELMDFRKAESGNLTLHISEDNIISFISEIHTSFEHLAISRHIKTELVSSSDVIPLCFDREQLEKVFFNLLSNAFKFTPDGGCINVLIQEKKSAVEVRVIDNGRGIAPENLEKLFINYYQENDYGVQNTGYGIGLALSRSIIELHRGRIQVESEMGNRTCFTVTLLKDPGLPGGKGEKRPIETASAGEARDFSGGARGMASPNGIPTPDSTPGPGGQKNSVLIVEDNPEVRAFIRGALEEHYQVTESVNGLKGWETAIEDIPDLVISDVMMPEMDGLTLCGKLKTDERTSHIPVILLTAKTSTPSQISGLEMGADLYLTKPFSIHILELHMRNLLASREKMRQKFSREFVMQPKKVVINTVDEQFLEKAISFIEDNMEDPGFGVQTLSVHMAMSLPILYKKIKALTDMSVNDFIKNIRLKKAAQLLQEKRHTVYEVAYMVGYSDRKHFSKEFKKMFEVVPSEYAKTP